MHNTDLKSNSLDQLSVGSVNVKSRLFSVPLYRVCREREREKYKYLYGCQ